VKSTLKMARVSEAADVELLVGQRQRDEADEVEHPDEEEERGHVREPEPDRLRGQPLLGDLGLDDVVDRLADGLARVRIDPDAEAHEADPEGHRDQAAQPEVGDRLVDREVDRAEVDRQPGLELELVLGIEVLARGEQRREQRGHACCPPK
jgi:hypothetical protein